MSAPRLRLAHVSPWPPERSGIADYCAELVPHLRAHLEVTVYARDELAKQAPNELRGFSMLAADARRGAFDLALYHLGNDVRFHGEITRLLARVPGVIVLHEYVLHHLVEALTQGRPAAYCEELRYAYGATGEALGRRFVEFGVPVDPWAFPLCERFVDQSLGVIVHNQATRRRVLASRPEVSIATIPHHLALDALPLEVTAARRSLGVPEAAVCFASFGYVTRAKRLEVALAAFRRLLATVPDAVFLIAGELEPDLNLERALAGLEGKVILAGRLDLERFLTAMAACDVAVNLRHPTGGETSGTVIRLLGLGKPVIVSNQGSFAEIPDGCAVKVEVDAAEEDVLAAVFDRLARDPALRREMGANARAHLTAHHTLEDSAAAYAAFLSRVAAAGARPLAAVPPLAPYPPEDLLAATLGELTAELGDFGLEPSDATALTALAEVIVDLGLDAVRS